VRTTLFSPVFKSQTPERITKKELSNLIVIGTSTGGPNALRTILPQLKKDSPAAILIVQHMPEGTYTASLANYLNSGCHFHVKEGKEGDIVSDGNVYIAPGGYHMDIIHRGGHYQLVLNKKEPVTGHRPSVDAIMRSVLAADINVPVFAVILTGMGSDGTRGIDDLKRERKRPLSVIAESKETVVIYGMPRQVIEHGLADHVLPLTDIIPHIEKKIK
jgi:two-component system chemotaxis response regulator CheB